MLTFAPARNGGYSDYFVMDNFPLIRRQAFLKKVITRYYRYVDQEITTAATPAYFFLTNQHIE